MSYYKYHVFICCNRREGVRTSCNKKNLSSSLRQYAKEKIKALGFLGRNKIRVNQSGCLDRCEEGPVLVIYPDETWYTYLDEEDIDEIIEQHLIKGNIVERLKI